jgi:hypothetical protein
MKQFRELAIMACCVFAALFFVTAATAVARIHFLERRIDALARVSHAELTAYRVTLNDCQALLTQRGNEIERCVDDNEEFANELAEGCARVRTTNPTEGAGRRSGSSPLRSAPRFQSRGEMGPAATPGLSMPRSSAAN